MSQSVIFRYRFAAPLLALAALLMPGSARADEHLFGWVRSTETLPKGHFDLYETLTFRTGKDSGEYRAFDSDTEVEYGVTDRLQVSLSTVTRYIYTHGNNELSNTNHFTYGGLETAAKYRILSPFKDPFGLAIRLEGGWLLHDEVAGLREHELFIAPELIAQKNFLDDTLITELNAGVEWAWGKKPAEQYPHEFAAQAGLGVSYRFAPKWFVGVEGHVRSEYPLFDLDNFEHFAIYAGPALHYAAERWWATLSWNYQVRGHGVDETPKSQTFAEESRQQVRLKVGLSF